MNGYTGYSNRSTNGVNNIALNDLSLDIADKIIYCDYDGELLGLDSTTNGFLKNNSGSYVFTIPTLSDIGVSLTDNRVLYSSGTSIATTNMTGSNMQLLNTNITNTGSTVEINNKSVIMKDITGSNLHLTIIPNGSNNGNCVYDLPNTGSYQHYFNDNLSTAGILTSAGGLNVSVVSSYPNTKLTTTNQGARGVMNFGNALKTSGQQFNFLSSSYNSASNPAFQIWRDDTDLVSGDGNLTILNKGILNSMILNNNSASSKIKIQNNSVDKLIVDNTNTTIYNNLLTSSITASSITTNILNVNTFNQQNITASTITCYALNSHTNITASNYITTHNLQINNRATCSDIITSYNFQCDNSITASNTIQCNLLQSNNNIHASNAIFGLNFYSNNNITASALIRATDLITTSTASLNNIVATNFKTNTGSFVDFYTTNATTINLNASDCIFGNALISDIYAHNLTGSGLKMDSASFLTVNTNNLNTSSFAASNMISGILLTASLTASNINTNTLISGSITSGNNITASGKIECSFVNIQEKVLYHNMVNNNLNLASGTWIPLLFDNNNYTYGDGTKWYGGSGWFNKSNLTITNIASDNNSRNVDYVSLTSGGYYLITVCLRCADSGNSDLGLTLYTAKADLNFTAQTDFTLFNVSSTIRNTISATWNYYAHNSYYGVNLAVCAQSVSNGKYSSHYEISILRVG